MNEEKARRIINGINEGGDPVVLPDNGLDCIGRYVSWLPHDMSATLDDTFTAEELEAIAWWMKNKQKPNLK